MTPENPDNWRELEIYGVRKIPLDTFGDDRGRFLEVFRKEWVPGGFSGPIQVNCSSSGKGVLRGLHYHRFQTDLWVPVRGRLRAGLVDTRRDSPTFGRGITMDIDGERPEALLIPPGVAHGFVAFTDLMLIYVVDRYFDTADELGIAWDDPGPGLDWGLAEPILSKRDRENQPFNW